MHAFEIRFHNVLLEQIQFERNKEAQHLSDGKASDWADYNRRVGVLEGLKRARELANKLAEETVGRSRDEDKAFSTMEHS